jgi:GT2 family glycosyltransferase
MTMFHIILPVHNRVNVTLNFLEHLTKQTTQNFEVYVIDDGSTDKTSERVTETFSNRLDLHLLRGNGELWWTGATYLGIEEALKSAADDDCIVMMNDDVTFDPDFFEKAQQIFRKYPKFVFSPLIVDDRDHDTICKSGAIMKAWPLALSYRPLEGRKLSERKSFPEITEVDFLRAQATFVPVRTVHDIGNVEAKLLPHYHADSEYSYRARQAGYRVVIHRDLHLYHTVGSTGSFNAFHAKLSLHDFWKSLSDIKSVNALKYKVNFARLTCPTIYFIPFMVSDTIKVFLRSLGMIIFGERIVRLRVWANNWFESHHG